jgi:hypothetical protein
MAKREQEPEPRTKITGEVIGKFHGLTIYGKVRQAKTHGRTRIWIDLRQADLLRCRHNRRLNLVIEAPETRMT